MKRHLLLLLGVAAIAGSAFFFLRSDVVLSILAPTTNTEYVRETGATQETFLSLLETTERIVGHASNVLLKNAEFQRAASYASTLDEAPVTIGNTPLTEAISDALVNIFCQYKTDTYTRTTTGTGFFIHSKGIILSNAHVAQFLLLEETDAGIKDVDCVIRTGNPAKEQYKAELMYISPLWVYNNADLVASEAPRGTGERDYALLYVSKSLDSTPLPTKFPALPVDVALLSRGVLDDTVLAAGYPAEQLFRKGPDAKLAARYAETTVRALYTFGSNYADIFAISESVVGEQGASGGPVVHKDVRKVIGLIVTKGDEALEGSHSLRAHTLSYIDRTMKEETGYTLIENMKGDPALRGGVFKKAMSPFLAEMLGDEIKKADQ